MHPELGTIEDFDDFVTAARDQNLEVALDLALQAAPDHPWAKAHPEWFTVLPDGTIAYAENPPKKYQDIYPINFDNDPAVMYNEVLRVVRYWISHGVKIFRVDNPHTKPPNFWAWLIGQVKATDPDVLFLAEAFTRPARLYGLAKLGFTQSYSYFTWRTAKWELTEFGEQIVEHADYARPNLFVNTPDILHESLQHGGPGMFERCAVSASTFSPAWGVYSGYELFEHRAVREGSEEYLELRRSTNCGVRATSKPPRPGASHWNSNTYGSKIAQPGHGLDRPRPPPRQGGRRRAAHARSQGDDAGAGLHAPPPARLVRSRRSPRAAAPPFQAPVHHLRTARRPSRNGLRRDVDRGHRGPGSPA